VNREDILKLCGHLIFEIKKFVKNEMFNAQLATSKLFRLLIPYNSGKAAYIWANLEVYDDSYIRWMFDIVPEVFA